MILYFLLFSIYRCGVEQAPRKCVPDQRRQQVGKFLEQGRMGHLCEVGCDAGEHVVQRVDLGGAGLARRSRGQPCVIGADKAQGPAIQRAETAVANEWPQLVGETPPGLNE